MDLNRKKYNDEWSFMKDHPEVYKLARYMLLDHYGINLTKYLLGPVFYIDAWLKFGTAGKGVECYEFYYLLKETIGSKDCSVLFIRFTKKQEIGKRLELFCNELTFNTYNEIMDTKVNNNDSDEYKFALTLGDVKKCINELDLPDDTPVYTERIHDWYFSECKWLTKEVKCGEHKHTFIRAYSICEYNKRVYIFCHY